MKHAIALALMLTFAACAVSEEEIATPDDESAPKSEAAKSEAAPSLMPTTPMAPAANPSCNPGPSGNWCSNREGRSCPVEGTHSRCYIPNYCEWALLRCEGGVWVNIG